MKRRPEPAAPTAARRTPRRSAQDAALALLARRDHSRAELCTQLARRGHAAADIDTALAALLAAGYLDETRAGQALVRLRRERGYGPLRIRAELKAKGYRAAELEAQIVAGREGWALQCVRLLRRRYGAAAPADAAEAARRLRFLLARGFPRSAAQKALGLAGDDAVWDDAGNDTE